MKKSTYRNGSGYRDHSAALKPQTMSDEERMMAVEDYRPVNGVKKLIKDNDPTIQDNFYLYQHGSQLEKKLGRPLSYSSVEIFEEQIANYIQYCIKRQLTPMDNGLALWLGVNNDTLKRWERDPNNIFSNSIKRASELFHNIVQQKVVGGEINPVLYMFLSKNLWGFSDKTELVHRSSTRGAIDLDEQQRIINTTPGIVIDAEYSESKETSKQIGTIKPKGDLVAQTSNLKDSGDFAEDLEKLLAGDLET